VLHVHDLFFAQQDHDLNLVVGQIHLRLHGGLLLFPANRLSDRDNRAATRNAGLEAIRMALGKAVGQAAVQETSPEVHSRCHLRLLKARF
jgi:hypothetical protein